MIAIFLTYKNKGVFYDVIITLHVQGFVPIKMRGQAGGADVVYCTSVHIETLNIALLWSSH